MAGRGRQGRKRGRLSRSGDFDRAYRDGRSQANRYLVVYAFPRGGGEELVSEEELGGIRLGISVGRRVGSAVERNRVKRALRECFWELADRLPPRHDFVLVARAEVAELLDREGPSGLRAALEELLAATGGSAGPR